MKRGWLAVALLVALVVLAAWHTLAIDALTGRLMATLEQAETLAEQGDWQGATVLTRQARERWEGDRIHLHITLDHAVVDEISTDFAETLEFLELREVGEYSASNARLVERLKLLGETERPTAENLF